jgi:hypothetical protein
MMGLASGKRTTSAVRWPAPRPEKGLRMIWLQLLLSPWYEIRSKAHLFSTILRVYAQEIAENRTKIGRIQLGR